MTLDIMEKIMANDSAEILRLLEQYGVKFGQFISHAFVKKAVEGV
jgi:hypothetical protein